MLVERALGCVRAGATLVLPKDWVIEVRLHQFHDAAEHRLVTSGFL